MPAGSSDPAGPLSQGAYDFRRSPSLTDAFTCFIASGGCTHAQEGEVVTAQIPVGLVISLHSY